MKHLSPTGDRDQYSQLLCTPIENLKMKVKILQLFFSFYNNRIRSSQSIADPDLYENMGPDRNTAYRCRPTRSIYLKGMQFDLSLAPNMLNENKSFRRMCR